MWRRRIRHHYNIDESEYFRLLELQGGHCAMCPATSTDVHRPYLSVDHDHSCCPGDRSCGKCIRGLVCGRHNHMLGNVKDSPEELEAGAEYLRRPRPDLRVRCTVKTERPVLAEQKILDAYREGSVSLAALAREHNVDRGVIYRLLIRKGIDPRYRTLYSRGKNN